MSLGRISILGLGLIGGSIALAIRARLSNCKITAYDQNRKSLQDALAGGAVQAIASSVSLACEEADCVILCVPPAAMLNTMTEMLPHLKAGICVTDVCSTKQTIVEAACRLLPEGVHFVGAHPMAGRELSGFAAARADLFSGALCLTTPIAQTNPKALDDVESLWRSLGAKTVRLSPLEHDRLVAQISHLPHALASVLMNAVSEEAMKIAGPGFRDVTRIAASDSALWRDILLDNAPEVRRILKGYQSELAHLDALLASGQAEDLHSWLTAAALRRKAMGRAGG
jgi:prephenate dehydrogenase